MNDKTVNINPEIEGIVKNGDAEKILMNYPDGFFNLIITSPPYNVGKAYETKVPIEKYLSLQERIISQLIRVLSDTGSICWQVGNYVRNGEIFPLDIFYYSIFKKHGLKLRNRVIWHFGHGLHASNRFSGRYETILWFTKNDDYIFNLDDVRIPSKYPGKLHYKGLNKGKPSGNPLGKNPSDVWEILVDNWDSALWNIPNVKSNHPEKTTHPCQFPVELVERCVLALTNENGWVLDPFGGVGSTLIASYKNGRNSVSIDKENDYCVIAENRFEEFKKGKLRLRPIDKPIHTPSPNDKITKIPTPWEHYTKTAE